MKKIFSLILVMVCWMGSVWGQTIPSSEVGFTNVTCLNAADGTIFGTITKGTTTPPYEVYLYENNTLITTIVTYSESFKFENLPPSAPTTQYRLRVSLLGGSTAAATNVGSIVEPSRELKFNTGYPAVTDESCGVGEITLELDGGTTPTTPGYKVTVTYPDNSKKTHSFQTNSYIFENLKPGKYDFEVYSLNGCGPITGSATISPSAPITAEEDRDEHVDILCHGDWTGEFKIDAYGSFIEYDFYLSTIGGEDLANYTFVDYDLSSLTFSGLNAGKYYVIATDYFCTSAPVEIIITEPSSLPEAEISNIVHVDCFGNNTGSISVSAIAGTGTPGYDFTITPDMGNGTKSGNTVTFSNLVFGNYRIEGTDGNTCTITIFSNTVNPTGPNVAISQPAKLNITSATPTPLTCDETMVHPDGTITVNATGGTQPYIYKIESLPPGYVKETLPKNSGNHLFDELPAGTYKITVIDANGCPEEFSSAVTVDAAAPIVATITPASPYEADCSSEVIKFKVTALTAEDVTNRTFEYKFNGSDWQNLQVPLPPEIGQIKNTGNYDDVNIEIRYKQEPYKSDCPSFTATHSVKIPEVLTFSAESTPVDCNGNSTGTIKIKVTGGSGIYNLPVISPAAGTVRSNGTEGIYKLFVVEGLAAGEYNISVTDSKTCPGTPSVAGMNKIKVNEPAELKIENIITTKATCDGAKNGTITFTVTGGTGDYKNYKYELNSSPATSESTILDQPKFTVLGGTGTGRRYRIKVEDENTCIAREITYVRFPDPEDFDVIDWFQDPLNPITCHTAEGNVKLNVTFRTLDMDPDLEGLEGFVRKKGERDWVQQGVFNDSPLSMEFSGLGVAGETTVYEIWLKYGKDKLVYGSVGCHGKDKDGLEGNTSEHIIKVPSRIEFTATVLNEITCNEGNDGKIKVTAEGGHPGNRFEYRIVRTVPDPEDRGWVPGNSGIGPDYYTFENLKAGTYTIEVRKRNGSNVCAGVDKDNTSSVTITKKLENPPKLKLSVTGKNNILCPIDGDNGKITVSAEGGKPGYDYYLYSGSGPTPVTGKDTSPGVFEGLASGTYTIEAVDITGVCKDTIVRTITKPEPIIFSVNPTPASLACEDVVVTIRINLSSPAYAANKYVYRLKGRTNWKTYKNNAEDTIKVVGAKTYTIEMAYANKTNCIANAEQEIMINVQNGVGIDISGVKNGCPNGISATITVIGNTNLPAGASYVLWRLKPGFSETSPESDNLQNYDQIRTSFSPPVSANTYTGLAGGIYRVIATVDNCVWRSKLFDLTSPDELGINYDLTKVFPACPNNETGDGEMRIVAEGGTAPYTFKLYHRLSPNNYQQIDGHPANTTGIFTDLPVKSGGSWDDIYYVGIEDRNGCSMSPYQPVPKSDPFPQTPPLELDLIPVQILCEGGTGSATVNVKGGREEFGYEWFKSDDGKDGPWSSFTPTPGITENIALELGEGFYYVEVTDGCHDLQKSNVVEIKHSTLSIEIDEENTKGGVNCDGTPSGQITVKVTGGTANSSPGAKYIYVIKKDGVPFVPASKDVNIAYNPVNKTETYTVSGLGNGVYTIEVSDGKCSEKPWVEITLRNPDPLTVTAKQTGAFCHDDTSDGGISVTVNGGTPGYFVTITDNKNQIVVPKTAILPGERTFLISMDDFAVGMTKPYTVKVEDDKNCTVTKTVNLSRPKELKVILTFKGSQCVFPVELERAIYEGQGPVLTEWYLNGVELEEYKNTGSIETSTPGEYQVIVKDDHCIAESEILTVVEYATLMADYKTHGVSTCPGDNSGSIEILNPTGGVSGSKYVFQVHYTDGDGIVPGFEFKEYTNNVITGLTAGKYYVLMRLQGTDGTCVPELRIPGISITAKIQIDVVAIIPACENSGKTTVEFLVTWSDPKGNINVMLSNNGKEYWPPPDGISSGKLKYKVDLDTSGEWLINVWEKYNGVDDCRVIESITVPESLTFSWEPEDKDCVNSTMVTLSFKGGTAPYELVIDGARHSNIATNSFQVPAPLVINHKYSVKVSDNKCSVTGFIELAKPVDMDAITSASIIKDASCDDAADGYIVIQPDTYKFLWEKDKSNGNELRNLKAGTYKVEISNLNGSCGVTYDVKIDVANKLEVNIRGGDVYCPGADVMLFGEIKVEPPSNEVGRSVQWTLPDNEQVDWEPFKPVEFVAADASVTLTATINFSDASSCTSSKTFEVKLGDTPTLSPVDTMIYIPKGIALDLEVEAPNHTYYKWESSNPGMATLPQWPNEPVSPVTLQSPNGPYILTLTLSNASGCETKQNFYVDFALDLIIPNVFTPNGREPYNTWKYREIEKWTAIFDIQVNVFSRNGALVYSAKGYDNHSVVWDGRRNGENVPIGPYYYVVKLVPKSLIKDTPVRVITGWVTIMR